MRAPRRARRAPARLPVGGGAIWPIVQPLGGGRGWLAVLYAAGGQFWGADPRPGGRRRCPQPGQPAPPAEAGRSPLEHSHEESSWCSWRPFEGRARADGGWVCLACSTPSAIGPDRRGHRGSACTRSEPRALGAKCSVTLALERDTMGNPRFLVTRSPNGRGLAPIGTGQHQICLVRPFLSRKAIFFWVLWAPYPGDSSPSDSSA